MEAGGRMVHRRSEEQPYEVHDAREADGERGRAGSQEGGEQ